MAFNKSTHTLSLPVPALTCYNCEGPMLNYTDCMDTLACGEGEVNHHNTIHSGITKTI